MRVIRRSIYAIIALALIALVFTPRPIFKPDWKGAIEEAIAADDCEAAERLYYSARWFGMPGIWEYRAQLEIRSVCEFSLGASDTDISPNVVRDHLMGARGVDKFYGSSFFKKVLDTSWAARPLFALRLSASPRALKDLQLFWEEVQIAPYCLPMRGTLGGHGHPQYEYMRKAMQRTDDMTGAIRTAYEFRKEQDFCASRYLDLGRRHIVRGSFPETDGNLVRYWEVADELAADRHVIHFEIAKWKDRMLDLRNEGERLSPEVEDFAGTGFICPPEFAYAPWALYCANRAFDGEKTDNDAKSLAEAYYYTLLAERSGNNIASLREKLVSGLPASCRAGVEDAIKTDTYDSIKDVHLDRDFGGFKKIATLAECRSVSEVAVAPNAWAKYCALVHQDIDLIHGTMEKGFAAAAEGLTVNEAQDVADFLGAMMISGHSNDELWEQWNTCDASYYASGNAREFFAFLQGVMTSRTLNEE